MQFQATNLHDYSLRPFSTEFVNVYIDVGTFRNHKIHAYTLLLIKV